MVNNSAYTKFLWAQNLALGRIPNPFAKNKLLETALLLSEIELNGTLDPELPDGYLSIVLPILKIWGWNQSKINDFAKWVLSLESIIDSGQLTSSPFFTPSASNNGKSSFSLGNPTGYNNPQRNDPTFDASAFSNTNNYQAYTSNKPSGSTDIGFQLGSTVVAWGKALLNITDGKGINIPLFTHI
jgi:hypothetical protein